jgi:hypothetical protein
MREYDDASEMDTTIADIQKQTDVRDLINRYWHWSRKSAEAIIEKASAFFDAENLSEDDERETFYREVGYSRDDSTSKKYRKIGSRRSRLMAHLDVLPDDWTTIYEVAKLDDDKFQKLVDDNVLHPKITMNAIAQHLAVAAPSCSSAVGGNASSKRVPFAFDWNQVPSGKRAAFAKKLKALLEEFDVPVDDKNYATLETFIDDGQEGTYV